jgi:hypothetical protein
VAISWSSRDEDPVAVTVRRDAAVWTFVAGTRSVSTEE